MSNLFRIFALILAGLLAGCGSTSSEAQFQNAPEWAQAQDSDTLLDLFNSPDRDSTIQVNRYLWIATLDVLKFLPLEGADPFSGVIVTGWGRVAGTSGLYRATVLIQDGALDARSLRVAAYRQSGSSSVPVPPQAVRQIEDAILTRARQLKIAAEG
ncbi:DUF3576 domain-containing protein [Oceanomicrobium pacificus]|uniref:DUF3576 domain-containing protein n=1 Tax=Oceanomicrobium pacificus TaxID=2692916 RepID=A0A6B0TK03_9RHOB|nr:DUF3576 domain-containing protein [Oceanomicrobium pacificus]MXU64830.1 DUF3576 domain-containing protein [Oceanomicrobium pacificus]